MLYLRGFFDYATALKLTYTARVTLALLIYQNFTGFEEKRCDYFYQSGKKLFIYRTRVQRFYNFFFFFC